MKTLLSALCLLALASCMSFSDKPLRGVRDSISRQLPEISLKKEFALAIGPGMFNLVDSISLNNSELSEMDHVQVAVYNVHSSGGPVDFSTLNFEDTLIAKDPRLTWETIVKVRDRDEQVWVLVGMDMKRETLEAVVVFSLQQDELVLINVDGNFNQLLEFALRPAEGHRGAPTRQSKKT